MPIRAYLGSDSPFGAEDLKQIGQAFAAALNKLGLHDRSDGMVEIVARRIIRAALAGERNPEKLTEIATGGGQN